jgi:isopentenyl phosphate kinase
MRSPRVRLPRNGACIILKIGGSLLTHRDQACRLNHQRVSAYVQAIAASWSALSGRLILVLGGGSFGHNVVQCHGLQNGVTGSALLDRQMLTLSMLEMKVELSRQLRAARVPCFPFHTSSLLTTRGRQVASRHLDGVLAALHDGILPVLSGDVVFDHELGFVLFSSDRVPEMFLGQLDIARVVVLTDVPGVLDGSGRLVERVHGDNWRDVWSATSVSAKADVTGGMRSKFEAVLEAARRGIECLIADGSDPAEGIRAVLQSGPRGTRVQFVQPIESAVTPAAVIDTTVIDTTVIESAAIEAAGPGGSPPGPETRLGEPGA